jgi:curved DNA-binding protein
MDHYSVLGVNRTATPDEIKKAYRKLASQHHPDKGGDTAKFQQIQEAYAILSDPEKKIQYDNPQPQGFPGGFNVHVQGFDINDLFGQVFNNNGRGPFGPNVRSRPIYRTHVNVSLLDAYNGGTSSLRLQTNTENKAVNITIPKGIETGNQMRFEHLIDNGTLLIDFVVQADLKFERKGNDLYSNHSISVLDLIVGTSFEFVTISGRTVNVTVKPKTQPYIQLRLPGHGMPIRDTGYYGDQLILLKPTIPDNIHNDIIQSILRNR